MKYKWSCHCLLCVGLQLSLDGSWWRTRLFWVTMGAALLPDAPVSSWVAPGRAPVKMADENPCLGGGTSSFRTFAGRYLGPLLFCTITLSTTQVSVDSVCKGTRNHLLFITSPALDSGSPGPKHKHARSKSSINKRLKVSFTSEWAHVLCADDTWTDCVICLCPSDPAAEMWLLSDSSSGCAWHCVKKACQSRWHKNASLRMRQALFNWSLQWEKPVGKENRWFVVVLLVFVMLNLEARRLLIRSWII